MSKCRGKEKKTSEVKKRRGKGSTSDNMHSSSSFSFAIGFCYYFSLFTFFPSQCFFITHTHTRTHTFFFLSQRWQGTPLFALWHQGEQGDGYYGRVSPQSFLGDQRQTHSRKRKGEREERKDEGERKEKVRERKKEKKGRKRKSKIKLLTLYRLSSFAFHCPSLLPFRPPSHFFPPCLLP